MPSSVPQPEASAGAVAVAAAAAAVSADLGLSERAMAAAKAELREDRNTREQALQQFRDWIAKNQDLENCRTGESPFPALTRSHCTAKNCRFDSISSN